MYKRQMLYNESRRNSGLSEVYSREQILKTESGLDPYLYPNVNWIDKIYKNVSSVSNVNLNISGGSCLLYTSERSVCRTARTEQIRLIARYLPACFYLLL